MRNILLGRSFISAPSKMGQWLLWGLMTVVCIGFAATSFEFYFFLKADKVPSYARLLEHFVSYTYAFGAGSGMEVLRPYWRSMPEMNKIFLGIHTTLAAVCLSLGPFQFLKVIRRRPKLHRKLGYTYVSLGLVSMVMAVGYLILTPFEKTYGGAPFAIGLWGIAILSTYSFIAGTIHAVRGEIWQHKALMTLNFCALLIAPVLRIGWLSLGMMFPKLSQMQVHTAVLMFIGVLVIFFAVIATNLSRPRNRTGLAISQAPTVDGQVFIRFKWPIFLVFSVAGLATFWISYSRIKHPELSLFFAITDEPLALSRAGFAKTSWAFAMQGTGGLIALISAPLLLLFDGFFGRINNERAKVYLHRFFQTAFLIAACFVGFAHLIRANMFGTNWIRGWGGSVFEGTMGTLLIICTITTLVMTIKGDERSAREFNLHSLGVLLIPFGHYIGTWVFVKVGFGFEDEWRRRQRQQKRRSG